MSIKSKTTIRLATWLTFAVLGFIKATTRVREHGADNVNDAKQQHGGFIYSLWHQDLISCTLGQQAGSVTVLASRSPTADPLVKYCEFLGYEFVRGSSRKGGRDKGGQAAKEAIIAELKSGKSGAITPDGPTGPAKIAKPGIVDIASATGLPIIPLCVKASRYWQFNSWDNTQLPKPFSRLDVYYGAPIMVSANPSTEEKNALLEAISQATSDIAPV